MTSTLGIKKIQYPNGTDIMTLDSSGTLAIGGNTTVGGTLGVTGVQTNSSTITGTILKGTTSLQSPLIEFTDGDDAIAIANGGYVTNPNIPAFLTYGTPTMTATSAGHGYFHSFGNSGQSFNNGSHYNNSTGKFTAPVAGRYMFGFSVFRGQAYSGGDQLIYIAKNGTGSGYAYVGTNASGSHYDQLHVYLIYNMAVNDFAVPLYYVGSGTFSIQASTPRNYFYGFLIG